MEDVTIEAGGGIDMGMAETMAEAARMSTRGELVARG